MALRGPPASTDRLQFMSPPSARTKAVLRRVMGKLVRNSMRLGAVPLPMLLNTSPIGRGFHTGGTFPMRERPEGLETDPPAGQPGLERGKRGRCDGPAQHSCDDHNADGDGERLFGRGLGLEIGGDRALAQPQQYDPRQHRAPHVGSTNEARAIRSLSAAPLADVVGNAAIQASEAFQLMATSLVEYESVLST